MLFTSLEFLLLFLPLCLGVYYLMPPRWGLRNYWLLAMSLGFYAWGEPSFVFVMLGSIAFNYVMAVFVSWVRTKKNTALALLVVAVAGNLAILGVWKYANFVTATLRAWMPVWQGAIPQTSFVLPIGISFFTFQAMSYVIDVYRGTVAVQKNPFYLALYIALFPQLIAGPIVRYSTVCAEIENRRTTMDDFASGVMRFLSGFAKKMLLANTLAATADKAFALASPSLGSAWLGAICYTFQIFFDFSGYSDMAIGLGRMFGFHFEENFNYPYIAKTVTEFWRRWHISLGSWFRDYVYFPMGGSRVNKLRLLFNLAIVWFLTGVWHGANWTFILWGSLYGVLIMAEKMINAPKRVESSVCWRMVCQPLTLLAVIVGWVLFRSADLSQAGHFLGVMFGVGSAPFFDDVFHFEAHEIRWLLTAAIFFSVPTLPLVRIRFSAWLRGLVALEILEGLLLIGLFVVGVASLVMNAHNPFIYFNF